MNYDYANLSAILGPTNTGKTFLAFEKLISYKSGIFGFPLRLLARENYDKAVKKLGLNLVALITGEEKIIPKEAKYFFCTVESMPTNLEVECIVVDEIQLAADYERGHIFTDRILNARGSFETIFLGSLTIKNILLQLFPNIKIQQLNRFSKLDYLPKKNLSKLKPRSAVIAFNINKVYEIAESLRIHKGGAAIVLGSLSPRTRNSQVEVYEDKKVDYLVATDAIGMGLNLNINHVAFSSFEKFDGRYKRNLTPAEIGQIAGRAGRYKNDGTFGYTNDAGMLDPFIIQSIENHNFMQIQKIYWRNSKIDFFSINSVLNSLKQFPVKSIFIRKKNAEDEINFKILIEDIEIKKILNTENRIKLLWEVCRIPDFQKIFNDNYVNFLKTIFLLLVQKNKIPEEWISNKINKLQTFNGDVEQLMMKISQIRTWTYIANHNNWVSNQEYWQDKTQKIENILSDNLHIGLTNKFVDSSSVYFNNVSKENIKSVIEINNDRSILINGIKYANVNGFDLKFEQKKLSNSLFALSHVKKSIRNMIAEKISTFLNAPNDSLSLGEVTNINFKDDINILWGTEKVGIIKKGNNIFSPIAESFNSEFIDSKNKLLISSKLQNWIDNKIETELKPIKYNIENEMSSQVRAIAFNIFENLGTLSNAKFLSFLKNINEKDKAALSKMGIRSGAKFFFMPNFIKKSSMELCSILWKVYYNFTKFEILPLPKNGRVSFTSDLKMPESYWASIGHLNLNNFLLRIDVFERVFFIARKKIKYGPFLESSDLMNPVGCNSDELKNILLFCGFDSILLTEGKRLFYLNSKKKTKDSSIKIKKNTIKRKKTKQKNKKSEADPNSPFAVLEKLL